MNQRSHSYLKRFKTQRPDKPTISTRNLLARTPINKKQNDSKSKTPMSKKQIIQYIQLKHKDQYTIKCINHVNKKALFQKTDNYNETFCYQCAIKLVKMNTRLCKISQKSLFLRESLEKELQILHEYQKYTHQVISDIFLNLRQKYSQSYSIAKISQNLNIELPIIDKKFKDQIDFQKKIQSIIGDFNIKKVQFIQNSPSKIVNKQDNQKQTIIKSLIKIPKSKGGSKILQNKQNIFNNNIQRNQQNIFSKNSFFQNQYNVPEFSINH